MKKVFVTTIVSIGCIAVPALAQTLPKFSDYPAKVYTGKAAPLDYKSNPSAKLFKTRIKDSLRQPTPDFAGNYSITSWGCGTSCVSSVMTDRTTGKVYGIDELAYNVTKKAPESCQDIPESQMNIPSDYLTKANSLLMIEQQYCKTDDNGKEIFLNNYLLWHEKTKTFTLLKQAFKSVDNKENFN